MTDTELTYEVIPSAEELLIRFFVLRGVEVIYERTVRAFHARYPWVKLIQPWNEANSSTQPTGTHPEAAAAYYRVVTRVCPSCTSTFAIVPLTPALWTLNVFIASMMQTSVSSFTGVPTETNGFSPGLDAA